MPVFSPSGLATWAGAGSTFADRTRLFWNAMVPCSDRNRKNRDIDPEKSDRRI